MWNDCRLAARTLRKSPGFTAVAVATLALAIGAISAVFSLVDAAMLRPLAYRNSERLYSIHEVIPKFAYSYPIIPVNVMHFQEWRNNARSFEQMALIEGNPMDLTGAGEPERVSTARVSPNLFRMLGIQAEAGRLLLDEEGAPGRDDVVVIAHDLWLRRFGGDPALVGRKILLNGRPYQVVGVLPAGFHFPKLSQLYPVSVAGERPQVWRPLAVRPEELQPFGNFSFVCIALLRDGVPPATAQAELNALEAAIATQVPGKIEMHTRMVKLQDQIAGRARGGLELMLAAVAAVLLIACVNLANLLLARATGRRRELALRSALGAGMGRLLRQMMAESALLAAAGGVLGMAIAYAGIRAILAYAPLDLPRLDEVHPDLRLLAFHFAIAAGAGLLSGLLPAWRFAKADPQEALKSGARGSTAGRSGGRLRSLLVAIEVGLSAMCLIAAGLMLASFVKLVRVDKGFNADRVLTVDLSEPASRYPNHEKRRQFDRTLVERIAALPGIAYAGIANQLPLAGEGNNNLIAPEGTNLPLIERPLADIRLVNPQYPRAMGIPLRAGRIFEERDGERPVALVSAAAAARIWPGAVPLGKRFRVGADDATLFEIVGVVGDVRGPGLNKPPAPTVYLPYWQRSNSRISLVALAASPGAAAAPAIRAAIRQLDPEMPVPALRTMDELVAESVAPRRFQMTLVLLFAAAALLLASLGIYGVVSYAVGQRTGEMGIRMALGADPARIMSMVLRQGMAPVAAGLVVGVAASLALGRWLSSLLFGVAPSDPLTMVSVVVLLAAVATIATCIPARRATRIDPVTALRQN